MQSKLFRSDVFKRAKKVMFYISFDGEVDTHDMIKAARLLGKITAVPACLRKRQIVPCMLDDATRLVKGLYGIREPERRRPIAIDDIDVVVVPGVAFDKEGRRLGRGKGYYDRFLRRLPPSAASIGLAFDFQIVPRIPTTERDVRVNRVIAS